MFSPGSVATALAAAATTAGTSTDTGTGTDTTALLQQLLTTAQQTYAVSQAQYAALASTPPFGGHFAQGGVVPGPIGAPRVIVAHGGETVSPQANVSVELHDHRTVVTVNGVEQVLRQTATTAMRLGQLPGSRRDRSPTSERDLLASAICLRQTEPPDTKRWFEPRPDLFVEAHRLWSEIKVLDRKWSDQDDNTLLFRLNDAGWRSVEFGMALDATISNN